MLARAQRIVKNDDFGAVYRYGKGLTCGMISLKFRKNSLGVSRFGVICGLKFSKSAVKRNRIKRQIREIIRQQRENVKTGYDIVISVRKSDSKDNYSSAELKKTINESLVSSNLIKKDR